MKRILNAGIGGKNFVMDEDAYSRMELYLTEFRKKLSDSESAEVMDDLEQRIAELFEGEIGMTGQVVTLNMVGKVISQLGLPDGSAFMADDFSGPHPDGAKVEKKLYRDDDGKTIAGICSGLALYFDIDVTLIRILMLVLLLGGSIGFWIYVILWIAVPKADTAARKCEMRGWPVNAENMAKISRMQK